MTRTRAMLTIGAAVVSIAGAFLLNLTANAEEPAGSAKPPDPAVQTQPVQPVQATDPVPATQPATTPDPASLNAQANASNASEVLAKVRKDGATVDVKERTKFEADLEVVAKQVEADAKTSGDVKVAERLGNEFGMTPDALIAERNELGTSWGQLMIAHTLMSNASAEVTARQVFDLRTEGMGWGQIAHGMGLKLGPSIAAVKSEARVARGLEKADGKVSAIQGPGSRAGASAAAKAAAKANIKASATGSNAKVGAGVGVGATGGTKVDTK